MTKVAIVILNWNGIGFLEKFLPILIQRTAIKGSQIIVADNNSSDASLTFLEKNFPQIEVIKLSENHGFAGGYNLALEKIKAEYFLLLNSDIEVSENWLQPLLSFMDDHKDYAACSPVLLDYENKSRYEYAGAAGGYIDKFGYAFCRGRIFNTLEESDPELKLPVEVFWTSGACMMIRSDIFHKAGGFDSHFFAHMEEIDLCWRLKNSGHKLALVPESKVYHVGGGTLPKSNPFKTYLNFRNNLLMLYKNISPPNLVRVLFIRRIMDGLSIGMFLLSFKFKDIKAILNAHRDYRRDKKMYEDFRRSELEKHGYPELIDIYQRSIVLDYFLAGRRRFNKLRDRFAVQMDQRIIQ